MQKFQMMDMGEFNWFLGMKITLDRMKKELYLDQIKYIKDLLKKFYMDNCKSVVIPIERLLRVDVFEWNSTKISYREAVGCLMYFMIGTRPNVAFAASIASRFLEKPAEEHWIIVKRIIRYLKGTKDLALKYSAAAANVHGYYDADWAGSQDDRK